jgi:hypothetical protein
MGAGREIQAPAAVPGANDHLKLVSADLLEQGSFDQAVEGCDGVFHTASLFSTKECHRSTGHSFLYQCFFFPILPPFRSQEAISYSTKKTADIFIKAANCFQI